MAQIHCVDDDKEMEKVVDDFIIKGYKIKNLEDRRIVMKKGNWGTGKMHLVVAILTIWWTMGLGNVAYAVYNLLTTEKIEIKVEE